jgi:urea-proton symporter
MGLSARALQTNPAFPTYPYALSAAQQSAGLVAPAAAAALLGTGGAVAILIVVFMAATSAASAELIAVSSIIVYDILGTYWKPLKGKQVVLYSHTTIVVFAVWLGAWATILNYAGIDLGWLFYVQGVALSGAVAPIAFTVCWQRMSKYVSSSLYKSGLKNCD